MVPSNGALCGCTSTKHLEKKRLNFKAPGTPPEYQGHEKIRLSPLSPYPLGSLWYLQRCSVWLHVYKTLRKKTLEF